MKFLKPLILLAVLGMLQNALAKMNVVTTSTIVTDMVKEVGGDCCE